MVQHFARRRLFGGSFGSPLAHYFIGPRNLHGDPKERFVIAAHAVDQVIARQSFGARLDPLLQAGFGVSRRRDVGLDQWLPGRGDKARRGRQTGVKIERAKHRFHGVGENRRVTAEAGPRITAGHDHVIAKVDGRGDVGESLPADQFGVPA